MRGIIRDKKIIAEDTLWIKFELDKNIDFISGQFFFITLSEPSVEEQDLERHFTAINISEGRNIIEMATRIREKSGFKRYLRDVELGKEVQISDLSGSFVLPKDQSKEIVLIAGGIGITPYISMLRYVQKKRLNYKITLIYSNRNTGSTVFLDELEQMAKNSPNLKLILIMTNDPKWTGAAERINEETIKKNLQDIHSKIYYVCGPPTMVLGVHSVLKNIGIKDEDIKTESFSGY